MSTFPPFLFLKTLEFTDYLPIFVHLRNLSRIYVALPITRIRPSSWIL